MTTFQKIVKYSAFALAICLSVGIIGGIVGAVAIVGVFLEGGNVLEEVKGYEISSEIKSIDIKISAADFEIIEGDRFFVESDIKDLTVKEKNGTLVISEKRKFNITHKGAVLNLYVPKGVSFEKVEITSGAGTVDIGVRYELPDEVMKDVNKYMYEGKFVGYLPPYNDKVRTFLDDCKKINAVISELSDKLNLEDKVKVVVYISSYKTIKTKNGDYMASLKTMDETGELNVTVFPKEFLAFEHLIKKGNYVYIPFGAASVRPVATGGRR